MTEPMSLVVVLSIYVSFLTALLTSRLYSFTVGLLMNMNEVVKME
jgi:hypothetical protein